MGAADEQKRTIETEMTLVNTTKSHLAFKIKTTRPKSYCVRPNSGVIPPLGKQTVQGTAV
jgi:hypothetical protein